MSSTPKQFVSLTLSNLFTAESLDFTEKNFITCSKICWNCFIILYILCSFLLANIPRGKSTDAEKSKHECDPGTKSEGEDENSQSGTKSKATLGRTPNHLTLSTTSTLSAGSTGSQARLIQSSQHPENYQPPAVKDLGKQACLRCYYAGRIKWHLLHEMNF